MFGTIIIAIIYMFMLLMLLIPMFIESKNKHKLTTVNQMTTDSKQIKYFLPEVEQYINKINKINNDERDIIVNKLLQHNFTMCKEYSKCDTDTKYIYMQNNSNLQSIFNYIDYLHKDNNKKCISK